MKRVPDRAYHLVDLGAGGCDLPVWLLQHARKAGLTLRVTAVDCDPRIVDHAQRNHAGCEGLEIVCGNALDLPSFGTMDYVFGNHFLHHLTAEEAVTVLRQCTSCTDRGFLFNDLSRSHVSLFAFNLLARLAYRKSFALEDGLQSIRRGFRRNELYAYCEEAGVESPRCGRLVPGRIWLAGGSMCSALTPPKGRGIAGRRQM